MIPTPIDADMARLRGLARITMAYQPFEIEMLERAIEQLDGIPCAVVKGREGLELWRSTSGMRFDNESE